MAEYYVNSFTAGYTSFDFIMMIGSTGLPSSIPLGVAGALAGELVIDAVIRTSPQHAKAMYGALGMALEQYEAQHGEIPVPKEEPNEDSKE